MIDMIHTVEPFVDGDSWRAQIDSIHESIDIFSDPLVKDVWRDKYALSTEVSPVDSMLRVANGIFPEDPDASWNERKHHAKLSAASFEFMSKGLWCPAGRIHAGAGTSKHVTLMNCYVNGRLDDSMEGIMDGLKYNALTLRMGGGMGTSFSTLRPRGASLRRLGQGAYSSGAVSFMEIWDASCATIRSAGDRRGAMMGTLICTHPDLPEFITAKSRAGKLTNFNVSVLVTHKFMQAVRNDDSWHLYFHIPPADRESEKFTDEDGTTQYIYSTRRARELWDLIVRYTYEYSEPGVIYIDRINNLNNLKEIEHIDCTNPCGEQPLPPHNACNLGAINLARMVKKPFTDEAEIDLDLVTKTVKLGVMFLDKVLDVTNYPLLEQEEEVLSKRRIGLGYMGLADMLCQLGIPYDSPRALETVRPLGRVIACAAYQASALLASYFGTYPLYNVDHFRNAPFNLKLDEWTQQLILKHGLRNSHLLTVAPTGTTSIYYGNVSSGLEPVFAHAYQRKVRQADDTFREYTVKSYAYKLYEQVNGPCKIEDLPKYMKTALQIAPDDHVKMQAACQEFIDASVSKTINCPADISFEEFKGVYELAYQLGCKGCTTYRPSAVRGSILSTASDKQGEQLVDENEDEVSGSENTASGTSTTNHSNAPLTREFENQNGEPAGRPNAIEGFTYKLKWPDRNAAVYVTINNYNNRPYELFFNTRSGQDIEWMLALSRTISSIMRSHNNVEFIVEELEAIESPRSSAWVDGKFYPSIMALIGSTIRRHIQNTCKTAQSGGSAQLVVVDESPRENQPLGEKCPRCAHPSLIRQEGCDKCLNCGHSTCG